MSYDDFFPERPSLRRRLRPLAVLGGVALAAQLAAGSITVKSGDTLYSLARGNNTTVAALVGANGLTDGNHIEIGQRLTLPGTAPAAAAPTGATTYKVRRGDSLYGIARRHNMAVAALAKANNLDDRNLIRVGQVLRIPGTGELNGATASPAAPTAPVRTGVTTIYAVRAGDTLSSISRRFNTTVAILMDQNRLSSSNLRVGQYLVVAT